MAVDAHGVPPRLLVTGDAEADCRPAAALTGGFKAGFLLADRASDTDEVLAKAAKVRADAAAMPSRSNRKARRVIDLHVYRQRHRAGNALERLKRWRGITVRYCKRPSPFAVAAQIRFLSLWLHIL